MADTMRVTIDAKLTHVGSNETTACSKNAVAVARSNSERIPGDPASAEKGPQPRLSVIRLEMETQRGRQRGGFRKDRRNTCMSLDGQRFPPFEMQPILRQGGREWAVNAFTRSIASVHSAGPQSCIRLEECSRERLGIQFKRRSDSMEQRSSAAMPLI